MSTEVKAIAGESPSSLNLILPEVYLESDEEEKIIEDINKNMADYVDNGTLENRGKGFVLLDRKTCNASSRKGLVVALDLEKYDYSKGSKTLIRATEGTIVDRLPPRIKVRQNASIELPHIMVLIDDPEKTVIEPLFAKNPEKIYDIDLMKDSGHISGYMIDDEETINEIAEKLTALTEPSLFQSKYAVVDDSPLLYAMGDGNHSLATAKAIWEKIKEDATDKTSVMDNPARYALVELVNLHDGGLEFEAIFRAIFNIDPSDMLDKMKKFYADQNSEVTINEFDSIDAAKKYSGSTGSHIFQFITENRYGAIEVTNPNLTLETATLQNFIDTYLQDNSEASVDYIHGEDVTEELGKKPGNIGFLLPSISKHSLFKTIICDGALPRKTFSMGEASEKRFYIECRKIK